MAFTLPQADEYGDTFPKSYWKPVQVNLCSLDKTGMVLFYGFESAANKGKRVIGRKSYAVTPEQFDRFFAADGLNPDGKNPWAAAYELALSVEEGTGKAPEGGAETTRSFFAGAKAV